MLRSFRLLNKFELSLWIVSVITVTLSFLLVPDKDILSLLASLIGVTGLIFVAKGLVVGQILVVIFSVFYGIISYFFAYYGEMITYLFMSAPMAIAATIQWYRHPYKNSEEVEIKEVTKKQIIAMILLSIAVTIVFYFVLKALGTAKLILSTISIATSFAASYLTYMRSPYYALGYALNDIVLIALWIYASISDIAYTPMIFCFVTFLANDLYGYVNWKRMLKYQSK